MKTRISTDINSTTTTVVEYFQELWNSQPNTVIGGGVAICVLLGIYIFLLNTYK